MTIKDEAGNVFMLSTIEAATLTLIDYHPKNESIQYLVSVWIKGVVRYVFRSKNKQEAEDFRQDLIGKIEEYSLENRIKLLTIAVQELKEVITK